MYFQPRLPPPKKVSFILFIIRYLLYCLTVSREYITIEKFSQKVIKVNSTPNYWMLIILCGFLIFKLDMDCGNIISIGIRSIILGLLIAIPKN